MPGKSNVPNGSRRANNRRGTKSPQNPAGIVHPVGPRGPIQTIERGPLARSVTIRRGTNLNAAFLTSATGAETVATLQFALNDLSDSADIFSEWDLYRITEVDLYLIPSVSMSGAAAGDQQKGFACAAIDLSDAVSSGLTVAKILAFANSAVYRPTDVIHMRFRPRLNATALVGATGSMQVSLDNQWVPTDGPNVSTDNVPAYYGVKVGISATTTAQTYHAVAYYTVECKNAQ